MTINLSVATKTARAQALLNALGSNATLTLYTGNLPTSADAVATGNLLATLTLASPFGVVTDGQLIANPIAQTVGLQNGTAGWGRISNSAGIAICDVDVGVAGSGAAILINTNILAAAPVIVAGLTISEF